VYFDHLAFWALAALLLLLGLALVFRLHLIFRQRPDCRRPRRLLQRVANTARFRQLAGLTGAHLRRFRRRLRNSHVCFSAPWQGGYAGHGPRKRVLLALSHLHLRTAPAAHELFHLVRHVRGVAPFHEDWFTRTIREEAIVWMLTIRYDPFRASLELLPLFALIGAVAKVTVDFIVALG
jgi:hypothetical protein